MKRFFTLLFGMLATVAHAQQPGTLDKTYGNSQGAEVVSNPITETLFFSSAIQADDKVVIGGTDSLNNRFVLSRHNKDGSIDTSFGVAGKVITVPNLAIYIFGVGYGWTSLAIQPDGKIVAAGIGVKYGVAGGALFNNDIIVARFLPNGAPDVTFGTLGTVITDLGLSDNPSAIALQADGKIVVAGDASGKLLVARYNTDGSPDKGFGQGNGYVLYPNNGTAAHAVAIQPDGKIVAGGSSGIGTYFFTARYLPDGTPDAGFGRNGAVTTLVANALLGGKEAYINSLALDESGRTVASGNTVDNDGNNLIGVVRYLPNGTLDNSFDKDGVKTVVFGNSNGYSVKVMLPKTGKIVLAGYAYNTHPDADFALASLNTDGSFDSSFGTNGETTTDFGHDENTYGAVMQSDGKIVLLGPDQTDLNYVYVLARYYGYPVHLSLAVRIKRWLQNHTLSWNGLPAEDKIVSYSVEQSSNGASGFVQVAKVSGAANLKDYSVTNSHLLNGANYYRIKAVSADGVVRYSEVVSADNSAASASVYPNPARDYVTVRGLQTTETADIAIKDGSGNVLARGVSNGSEQYRSSLGSNMQPGTYYLNITTGTKTEVLKFVKE